LFCARPGRGPDTERVVECGVDLGRVVRGAVVEQQGKRCSAGGHDSLRECLDHGGAILLVAHADADRGIGRRVDDELEVPVEGLAVDHHRELLAIAGPLRPREEDLEALAQGLVVTRSAVASRWDAQPVLEQDVGDERRAELEAMIATHVRAERAKASAPHPPRGEHGLDLRLPGIGSRSALLIRNSSGCTRIGRRGRASNARLGDMQ
jgi:hypothetical protein